MSDAVSVFEEHRADLARLAYRMLGSRADADDVLQEAYLRWTRSARDEVRSPRTYLGSIVTRLCIDQRRVVEARKESYVGPWLPEPIVELDEPSPVDRLDRAESVSLALMVVLESLTPTERAAYLLRKIFDYDYGEIAQVLERTEASCRQLVSRADAKVQERQVKFEPAPSEARRITGAFLQACTTGDLEGLVRMLADDAVLYSDGGGKALAARAPIFGADRVARFFCGVVRKAAWAVKTRWIRVNGQPGILTTYQGAPYSVTTFHIVDGKIVEAYIIRNPDKLPSLEREGRLAEPGGGQ